MIRTRGTPVKGDFVAIATTIASGEVKWHVHVPDEVNQKLERVLNVAWLGVHLDTRFAESLKLLQHIRGIPDGTQDVDVRPALPTLRTGESTSGTGIVVHSTDVVEWAGPSIFRLVTNTVRPCRDGCQVALASVMEDIAKFRHHGRVQVHLRDGRDDLMA